MYKVTELRSLVIENPLLQTGLLSNIPSLTRLADDPQPNPHSGDTELQKSSSHRRLFIFQVTNALPTKAFSDLHFQMPSISLKSCSH